MTMRTGFDDFTALSAHETLDGLAPEAIRNLALLLGIMTATGWDQYGPEWGITTDRDATPLRLYRPPDVPGRPDVDTWAPCRLITA